MVIMSSGGTCWDSSDAQADFSPSGGDGLLDPDKVSQVL